MKKPGYKAHLFICTNQRDGTRECCASKGSADLLDEVKKAASAKYGKEVRVNKAGCLDHCEKGIAAVMYPQNQWFLDLKKTDAPTLLAALDKALKS